MTPAIEAAREAGLMVIALDTKTDPADAVDVTFATDNFQAGLLIGQWAKAKLGDAAEDAVIGLIDINGAEGEPVVGVQRDQGFLQGFGIDVGDINLIGDESDPRIAGSEAGHGNQVDSVGAMERLLQANPDINLLYTINEPTARGAVQALETFGKTTDDVMIVSVDGGCEAMQDIEDGIIDATSQQYPSLMASLGVDWAVKFAQTGENPDTARTAPTTPRAWTSTTRVPPSSPTIHRTVSTPSTRPRDVTSAGATSEGNSRLLAGEDGVAARPPRRLSIIRAHGPA